MVADPMSLWQNYHIAFSVHDALETLVDPQGVAAIVAGGTDLFLDLQLGNRDPVHTIIDVSEIPEMRLIEIRGGQLFIGAAVTHKEISQSALVLNHCAALATASGLIGGPQVRNTATIGGNVAHALPAADGTIALLALNATAEVQRISGSQQVSLADLFLGPGKSALNLEPMILTGFYVDLRSQGQTSAFRRIMRPQGVAIAILNMAIWLQRIGDLVEDIRIVVGPSGPVPKRMLAAEEIMKGNKITGTRIKEIEKAILLAASFRTSRYRTSKEYRQDMVGILLHDTLNEAFELSG